MGKPKSKPLPAEKFIEEKMYEKHAPGSMEKGAKDEKIIHAFKPGKKPKM